MDISSSSPASLHLLSSSDFRTISPRFVDVSSATQNSSKSTQTETGSPSSNNASDDSSSTASKQKDLQQSQAYQQAISELKSRDQHVKAHEQAHLGASGGYATSAASYTYQVGPDGRRYAVGGEVGIDTSPVQGDPAATIQKAHIIQRAALAPSDPSSQDLRVHAQAVQMEIQASQQLKQQENTDTSANTSKQNSATEDEDSGNSVSESQSVDASRLNFEIRLKVNS
ncbi:putative metalloprotease CJM1_0395 family protein [Hydrogenovibrio marinus]|uniref:SrpA-related protein n=1 Tax=Hydrogenovibrio marinus TaxID=28885 RepID=A0A066ZS62_HYDMR|nr:putative metalloprotease CJM1_0395 family protein [Hydrogenovibrio marinus]KDN96643.1 hypothetical protein EI16_10350 [Hydrogenovibrio marinus]BBN58878.1 hypothetical protein HVMH_0472 [Hydrogenovibrio marinus]